MLKLYYGGACDTKYNTEEDGGDYETFEAALRAARIMAACMASRYDLCVIYDDIKKEVEVHKDNGAYVVVL